MTDWPVHARIDGPIVMIGFGSIGKGTLPLIERHFDYDRGAVRGHRSRRCGPRNAGCARHRFHPPGRDPGELPRPAGAAAHRGRRARLLRQPLGRHQLGRHHGARPRTRRLLHRHRGRAVAGLLFRSPSSVPEARSNYALRETVLEARRRSPGGITAVSCCGANPGMVSWFVKQALLDIARDLGVAAPSRQSREDWARLAMTLGVKGIHIAERDTQRARNPKPHERLRQHLVGRRLPVGGDAARRARLGHPRELDARQWPRATPTAAAPRSICCSPAPIRGCGHGRRPRRRSTASSSPTTSRSRSPIISRCASGGEVVYRPTCHYAYHPCNDAVLSLHELFGRAGVVQDEHHILDEHEIVDGIDELGVLIYGHAKNAYWYGSQLSVEETRQLAPYQNATGLQVTSAVLAGMVWALENPGARHRRGRRDGFPPLPRNPAALSRPGDRHLHRLDAAHRPPRPVPGEHRYRPIRGSSATCWCEPAASRELPVGDAAGERASGR